MSFISSGAGAQKRNFNWEFGGIGGPSGTPDPLWADVDLLFFGDVADGATTFLDLSNNGITGVRVGNPVNIADVDTILGSSFRYYQGNSSYIRFDKPGGYLNGRQWTIELTFNYRQATTGGSSTNYNTIVGTRISAGGYERILGKAGAGSAVDVASNTMTTDIALNTPRQCAMTYDADDTGGRINFYTSGVRRGTLTGFGFGWVDANNAIILGCINEVFSDPGFSHGASLSQCRVTNALRMTGASYTVPTESFPTFGP